MTKLVLGGNEVPIWRNLCKEGHVIDVALNFRELIPRLPKNSEFLVSTAFDEYQTVWLDSGTYGFNKKDISEGDLLDHYTKYQEFVQLNINDLDYVVEFDALALGKEWIESERERYWAAEDQSKIIYVWHPEWGINYLREMASIYENIGISAELDKVQEQQVYGIVRSMGIKLIGLGLQPTKLPKGIYYAVLSTSWLSPSKYGETQVWEGNRFRRFGKDNKAEVRKRYRNNFIQAGFDPDKIAEDKEYEVTRYTIWAWKMLEKSMEMPKAPRKVNRGVTPDNEVVDGEIVFDDKDLVDIRLKNVAETVEKYKDLNQSSGAKSTDLTPYDGTNIVTPGFEMKAIKEQVIDPDNPGQMIEKTAFVPSFTGTPLRYCDSCSLNHICPVFEPGAKCKINMPVKLDTRDKLIASLVSLLEMQYNRVSFMYYSESLQGGYADKNLTDELERMFKLTELLKKIEDNRDTLDITIKQRGGNMPGGVLANFFGQKATEPLRKVDPDAAEELLKENLG